MVVVLGVEGEVPAVVAAMGYDNVLVQEEEEVHRNTVGDMKGEG